VFNGYESAYTASVVIDTFSVMLTGQTNSRSVFSGTGHLANNEFLHITEILLHILLLIIKIF